MWILSKYSNLAPKYNLQLWMFSKKCLEVLFKPPREDKSKHLVQNLEHFVNGRIRLGLSLTNLLHTHHHFKLKQLSLCLVNKSTHFLSILLDGVRLECFRLHDNVILALSSLVINHLTV